MARKLTEITFYQNTPFTDFQNYIDFGSNEKRDVFFDRHYDPQIIRLDFNMVRDRLTLRVGASVANWKYLSECNYLSFVNFYDGIRYYCQVTESKYVNNNVTELYLVVDGLMTFCQGGIEKYAKNVTIERQHLPKNVFEDNLDAIRLDKDVLSFGSRKYIHQENYSLKDLVVVFRSSVNLASDFGTIDSPKVVSSTGITYDKIVSPQNLYMTPYNKFNDFMKEIEKYPWITQNITSVLLVPQKMLDSGKFTKVDMKTGNFDNLYKFNNNGESKNIGEITELSKSYDELNKIFGTQGHPELLKNGYCNIELTNFQGQSMDVDVGLLDFRNGFKIMADVIIGYSNQMYFYIKGYKSRNENSVGNIPEGSYIEDGIAFSKFDSAPLLTDNYRLDYASSANQRNLAKNNQFTGQLQNVMDNNASIQDRFFSAVSLTSNASAGAIMGKMTDEWQYYRKLNAELADKKLTPPSVSAMSTENSFPVKQGFFGLTVKYSRINDTDFNIAKNYYAQYGYSWASTGNLYSTNSMKYLNYVKFTGNWIINDRHVPQSIMEQIRAQFANGVKIWHNPDGLANPFKQDISDINTWA